MGQPWASPAGPACTVEARFGARCAALRPASARPHMTVASGAVPGELGGGAARRRVDGVIGGGALGFAEQALRTGWTAEVLHGLDDGEVEAGDLVGCPLSDPEVPV